MAKEKSIGQLLKELDAMQKQFDNVNEKLIIEKKKSNQKKANLSSKRIDDEFFKTFNTSLNDIKPKDNKFVEIITEDIKEDDLFFEIETGYEEVKPFKTTIDQVDESKTTPINTKETNQKSKKSKVDNIDLTIQESESYPIQKKVETFNDSPIIKDLTTEPEKDINKSYLTIKQKLEQIKEEIASKENEIKEEKSKVIQLEIENSKKTINTNALTPKIDGIDSSNKNPLTPQRESKSNKIESNVLKPKENNTKSKSNEINTVDKLTIIILILLIILIGSAWLLLK